MTKYDPTPTHYFVKMLQDKGVMWKNATQNIDNLEEKTGMNMDDVVQCHGAVRGAACSACNQEKDMETLQQHIERAEPMYCQECHAARGVKYPVKPNIVFFGEQLPRGFFDLLGDIYHAADLVMIMGTALAVSPFN